MFDIGFSEMMVIAVVALIVIGPERLPKVARTAGALFGRMQRYVSDVKAEVNRSMELDELKKMKTQFEDAARNVEDTVRSEVNSASAAFDNEWTSATAGLDGSSSTGYEALASPPPSYQHPKKNWRLKRGATPQWYKHRNGVRTKALSGAARVARFRPQGLRG